MLEYQTHLIEQDTIIDLLKQVIGVENKVKEPSKWHHKSKFNKCSSTTTNAYEDIITSEYDSIVSVLDQAIEAYKQTDIYEITDDNEEQLIGTYKDKMNALANYLRSVADDIEEKD